MKIKEKVRAAVETPNRMLSGYGINILKTIAKLYLAGKLVEPTSKEKMKNKKVEVPRDWFIKLLKLVKDLDINIQKVREKKHNIDPK